MNVPRSDSLPALWGIVFRQPLDPADTRRLQTFLRKQLRGVPSTPLFRREDQALTARQREVLRELVGGKGTKAIARIFGISHKTAESHRQNLMDRLGIDNLPGLVRYALHAGIVPPSWLSEKS